eukprot:4778303-Amphidinium_carterae.1
MGPGVVETINVDHSINPQQRTTEGVRMTSTSPREHQQTLLPTGSPATLSPSAIPEPDHGGEATHQWVPAGFGKPINPDATNGWFAAPWSSTATPMKHDEMMAKVASMSFSSHISQSGEYQHQTSS